MKAKVNGQWIELESLIGKNVIIFALQVFKRVTIVAIKDGLVTMRLDNVYTAIDEEMFCKMVIRTMEGK